MADARPQDPSPHSASRRSPWPRRLGGMALGLLALLAAGPTLVAWSPLRHDLPRTRMRGFEGEIRVGRASLSWFGPAVLHDVQFFDQDHQPFLEMASSSDERSILTRIFHPSQRPRLTTRKPVITVRLRPDGSNLQDALRPVLQFEGKMPEEALEFESTDGVLKVIDTVTGRTAEWTDIDVSIFHPPGKESEHTLDLKARPAGGGEHDLFTLQAHWQEPVPRQRNFARIEINGQGLPLQSLVPALVRVLPERQLADLSLTGESHCRLSMDVSRDDHGDLVGTARGTFGARDLQLAGLTWLRADQITLEESTTDVELELTPEVLRIHKFEARSPLGVWTATGALPRDGTLQPVDGPATIQGGVDLARLTTMLPHAIPLPETTEILSGALNVALRAEPTDSGMEGVHWKARIGTPRVEARIADQPVVWNSPIDVDVALRQEPSRWSVDSLRVVTPLLTLTGTPDGDMLRLTGTGDVAQLTRQLGWGGPDQRAQFAGTVEITGTLQPREERQLELTGQIALKDLEFQRLVTRMVERPRDPSLDPPPRNLELPERPIPPPSMRGLSPAERRAARAQVKAERVDRRNARREAAEAAQAERAARAADLIPVEEWQVAWSDPQLTLAGSYQLDLPGRRLVIQKATADTRGLSLVAEGEVTRLLAGNELRLQGYLVTTLDELVTHLTALADGPVRFRGAQRFDFEFSGPVADVTGQVRGGWQQARAFGLEAGPADLDIRYARQQATLTPGEMTLSGGRLFFSGSAGVVEGSPVLTRPAGTALADVQLTQEICNGWMQFVAPILSQATRAEGRFSLELDDVRLALQDLPNSELSGRLEIPEGRVLPGPLFDQLGQMIGAIETAVRRGGNPGDLLQLDRPLATIENQSIEFELNAGRLYHSLAVVELRKVAIATSGSVGLDQSLDLTAILLFPPEWVQRLPFLSGPDGRGIVIPVEGTLKKPRLEPGTVRRILKELGTGALEDLLQGPLRRLLER